MKLHTLVAVAAASVAAVFLALACGDGGESLVPSSDGGGDETLDAVADARESSACEVTPCIVDVAAGGDHACALTKDETVSCWGANADGQCGPSTSDAGVQLRPIEVPGLHGVTQIAIGYGHGCALTRAGAVWCWGSNTYGQVGQATDGGPHAAVPTPLEVTGFTSPVVELAAGVFSTCARMESGRVACWGLNNAGQLGSGTVSGATITPEFTIAPTLAPVEGSSQIGTTARVVCSLAKDGGLACWGVAQELGIPWDNDAGFIHPDAVSPLGVAGPVAEIGKGHGYAQLLRLTDGRVQVFGDNEEHVAGFPDAGRMIATATLIPGLVAKQVSISGHDACARRTDDTVVCWGNNALGANGTDPDAVGHYQDTPTPIAGITHALRVTVGWSNFACALIRGGSVRCWGNDERGQLGRGTAGGYDPVVAPVAF